MYVDIKTVDKNGVLQPVEYTNLIFPGGEHHVKLPFNELNGEWYVIVEARIGSAQEWMNLMTVLTALGEIAIANRMLFLPYFPGARADRVNHGDGTALSAAMYANMLKPFELGRIVVVDPHSDVTPALLGSAVEVISIPDVMGTSVKMPDYDAIIAPDQGAVKRAEAVAVHLGVDRVINGSKHRDMVTGQITGFKIGDFDPSWQMLMVDDICDGGGTFAGRQGDYPGLLAQIMDVCDSKGMPYPNVDLWVTHGIFSGKADKNLAEFRTVFYTDSFPSWKLLENGQAVHLRPSLYLERF